MAHLDNQPENASVYRVLRNMSSEPADYRATTAPGSRAQAADAGSVAPRIVPVLSHPLGRRRGSGSEADRDPANGKTILIVENEDSNRILMEKILGFAGYRCVAATNGQEALEVFDRERPDIVLTDISMPVMDGFEEIALIRARPEGARVPIVAVTAHAMRGDRESALREGCDEYLAKPYRPRDLLDVVARLLKEASV